MVLELLAKQHFDAVVLCNSIPAHIQENIAREAKSVNPKVPLIVICAPGNESRFQPIADRILLAEQGVSQPLLEAVSALAGDANTPPISLHRLRIGNCRAASRRPTLTETISVDFVHRGANRLPYFSDCCASCKRNCYISVSTSN